MRFSRLEIKGFKSFANETVIHFNEDVTGIVGPNGSGKSNIVDAIRWVLGEQKSTELRLDKMSSVIFNGTKNKKPAGMAQVSLIFENNKKILPVDFNEVKITRVLYQNGESEYKLNNVTCRLKDIYSLFVDTGVGSNTYAIIGFGMVEDLLNNKDHYRRMMIEQAAGISKYKSRKKETLSKLQITMDDLSRVDDLLSEIESNMNTLKKQARRAEKFLELKAKYQQNAIVLFHHQKHSVTALIENSRERFEQERQTAELKEMEIHKAEAEIEIKKNLLLEKELSLSEFQKKTNQILDEQKSLEKKRDLAFQRISFVKSKAEQAITDLKQVSANLAAITQQQQSLTSRLPQVDEEIAGLNEELSKHEIHYNQLKEEISGLESSTEPIIAKFEANNVRLFALEKENAIAQAQLTSLQSDAGKHKIQESALLEQQSSLSIQKAGFEQKMTALMDQINALQAEIESHNQELQNLKESRENIAEQKKQVERKIDQASHEIKLLRSLIDNQEGFPEAVKYLSSQNKNVEKHLVADLINCDEKYRTALENYLSPYLTHFVVNTYKDALDAIDLLSAGQKGKAGFIILEAYEDSPEKPRIIEGAIPLSSIIQCHPRYTRLFGHLLRNAYIITHISAKNIGSLSQNGLHFITEDGSTQISHGLANGGSIGLIEGSLLGRKIRLESLEEDLIHLKRSDSDLFVQLADIDEKVKSLQADNKSGQLETLQRQGQQTKESLLQINIQAEHIQLQLEKISADEAALTKKVADYNTTLQNNTRPIIEIKEEIERLNAEVNSNKADLKAKTETLNAANALVNSYKMNVIQAENKKTGIERELSLLTQQINSYQEQSRQFQSTQNNCLVEISSLESQLHETELAIQTINEQFKSAQEELSEVERLYFVEKKTINEEEQAVRQLQKALSNTQTIANEWKDKWQAARYDLKRIEDNFEIEFGAPPSPDDPEEGVLNDPARLSELEAQNTRIKASILQFGEVNPLALEAYQEIKTRYDEIVGQKNDILDSKDKLTQTLNELENTSTTKYLAAFEKIRENFKMVFRSLFTEDDDCDLIIEETGSPLDSDIGIIAKPKGKRPQSLSQLSGGEKTLTAIAFLFSLYLLKPAPFCIFDELDAPLDDVNVEKLNKIIRKFSAQSQFIIITHNKATMAAVDIMYGVYMEQQGISGLSKVDFRTFEHNLVLEKV